MQSLINSIFFKILRTTIYSTVAMTFFAWLVQASKYSGMLSNNISLFRFFKCTSLLAVDIVAFILPIALAISAGFVFHRFAESNQLISLQSAGISPKKLLKPLLGLSLIITGYLYISNAYLSPLSWRKFKDLEFNIKNNIEPPTSSGPLFSLNNFSVYAQKYLGGFTFENICIIDSRDSQKKTSMFAAIGTIEDGKLILSDGERIEVNFETHQNSSTKFRNYVYDLRAIAAIKKEITRVNEKFIDELKAGDPTNEEKSKEDRALYHQKLLSPILTIIFSLLAFFLVGLAPYKRIPNYKRIALLITLITIVQGTFFCLANAATRNPLFTEINCFFTFATLIILTLMVRFCNE